MVLLPGHRPHRHEDGDDDPELPHVLGELDDGITDHGVGDDPLELLAADGIDDLLDVARREWRHEAEDREDDEDDRQAQRADLLAHLLGEEQPQAAHRFEPSAELAPASAASLAGSVSRALPFSPTSSRKTSSSVGRTHSNRMTLTCAATSIGSASPRA